MDSSHHSGPSFPITFKHLGDRSAQASGLRRLSALHKGTVCWREGAPLPRRFRHGLDRVQRSQEGSGEDRKPVCQCRAVDWCASELIAFQAHIDALAWVLAVGMLSLKENSRGSVLPFYSLRPQ